MRNLGGIRHGFTLFELVVVVMILGILAAVAVPRLIRTSHDAAENSLRQTLSVIRNAIDQFLAEQGTLPGADGQQSTFKADMAGYLRGQAFPKCPVGQAKNDQVRMVAGGGPVGPSIGASAATHSWVYQFETGDIHINSTDWSHDGVTTYDEF